MFTNTNFHQGPYELAGSAFIEACDRRGFPNESHNTHCSVGACQRREEVSRIDDAMYPAYIKSIVFSSWTTTLDLIEAALEKAHIPYVRVVGRVSSRNRSIAFKNFRNDCTIKVMLLTISCGAEG